MYPLLHNTRLRVQHFKESASKFDINRRCLLHNTPCGMVHKELDTFGLRGVGSQQILLPHKCLVCSPRSIKRPEAYSQAKIFSSDFHSRQGLLAWRRLLKQVEADTASSCQHRSLAQ
ncbi:hypothetical protein SeMB42_g04586 [Synchytrium endobioticum]|uniref:Uncharacterized protein n=1 Tax=Synchytrium endobioticum TaxID=286115 RepID=A0A507CX09_9FUNG|nr:hypothetical protein SeMB42_g04586 [Synchytrium endobioticum]